MDPPHPWRIEYFQRFPTWHPKSSPRVVDVDGSLVCEIKQHVDHPGLYDKIADETAQAIVNNTNTVAEQLAKQAP